MPRAAGAHPGTTERLDPTDQRKTNPMVEEIMAPIDIRSDTFDPRYGAILTPAILSLAIALTGLAGAPAWAAPQAGETVTPQSTVTLATVDPVADLGTVVKGDSATHAFVLRNTGDAPVTIERVTSSCGCTVAEFDETIPPGGEGTVRAELDTLMVNGSGSSSIEVYAAGQEAPAVTLQLDYNVVSKLLAHPGYARWIYVQHEPEGTLGQTVYAEDGADFEVVSVESPMPAIAVTFREATPEERVEDFEGRQWRVEPTLDSEAPVGPIVGFLTVHITHPDQKVMQIPVSGFVRPALFVEPQSGALGSLELAAPRRLVFHVRRFATDPIAVTGAETDVPGISARVEPVEEGVRYDVVVELDPAAMAEGPFAGKLRLTTDNEKLPSMTVDLSGTLIRSSPDESG
jgi:hypothetical protein